MRRDLRRRNRETPQKTSDETRRRTDAVVCGRPGSSLVRWRRRSWSDARAVVPAPAQLVRQRWASLDGEWEFALDRAGGLARARPTSAGTGASACRFRRRRALSGVAALGFFSACWYRLRADALHHRRELDARPPPAAALRRRRPLAPRYGRTPAGAASTRGATRRSPSTSPRAPPTGRWRSWCAPTTTRWTWPSRAASRTGSSSRTRSGIRAPPASGRRCGWRSSRRRASSRCAGRPASTAGRSPPRSRWPAPCRTTRAYPAPRPSEARRWRATAIEVLSHEVNRRIAFPDPGVDDSRNELLVEPAVPDAAGGDRRAAGRRRAGARSGQQLHRAALDRRAGRPHLAQRPPVSGADGARSGLLAGVGHDRARRGRPPPRRRAGQGHGLQRRAQAPEDRGPALSLLGRPPGPAGLGGDAQRLSVHHPRRSSGSRANGWTSWRATTATPASWPGSPSTSRGACRTCRTSRPSATGCAGSIT